MGEGYYSPDVCVTDTYEYQSGDMKMKKYMKTKLKEEIYNKGKRDITYIEKLLNDPKFGNSNVAEGYKKFLLKWKDALEDITGRLSYDLYHYTV